MLVASMCIFFIFFFLFVSFILLRSGIIFDSLLSFLLILLLHLVMFHILFLIFPFVLLAFSSSCLICVCWGPAVCLLLPLCLAPPHFLPFSSPCWVLVAWLWHYSLLVATVAAMLFLLSLWILIVGILKPGKRF